MHKDYFGNPIMKGDILLRVVNGKLAHCICTRTTQKRVYFTYDSWIWGEGKYEVSVKERASDQALINCTALNSEVAVPFKHLEFFNNLNK